MFWLHYVYRCSGRSSLMCGRMFRCFSCNSCIHMSLYLHWCAWFMDSWFDVNTNARAVQRLLQVPASADIGSSILDFSIASNTWIEHHHAMCTLCTIGSNDWTRLSSDSCRYANASPFCWCEFECVEFFKVVTILLPPSGEYKVSTANAEIERQ